MTAAGRGVAAVGNNVDPSVFSPLTARELEVLALAARAMSNRQVARTLGISEKTVKNHLGSVFRKLGTTSRTAAILVAGRRGLLAGEEHAAASGAPRGSWIAGLGAGLSSSRRLLTAVPTLVPEPSGGVRPAEVGELSVAAGRHALTAAGVGAGEIDAIVMAYGVNSKSACNAAEVAASVGMSDAGMVEMNARHTGFGSALGVADGMIRSGVYEKVLTIGTEDGPACAGAALLVAADSAGIGPVEWEHCCNGPLLRSVRDQLSPEAPAHHRAREALDHLTAVARRACASVDVDPTTLAALIPHGADLRVVEALGHLLGADGAVIPGHLPPQASPASVPLALGELAARHVVHPGGPVLLVGHETGTAFAAQLIRAP